MAEQIVADITWLDTQVSMNGFYGWFLNTTSKRIYDTLNSLDVAGCAAMGQITRTALAVIRIEPPATDRLREKRLNALSEKDLERLMEIDAEFYGAVSHCIEQCRAFVRYHKDEITV